jgi:hypothetical protein
VGNILRRHDIPPAPKRKQATSWNDFIRAHMAVLVVIDFFTVEVLALRGLITYYVLFFIHLESRRICLAGGTRVRVERTYYKGLAESRSGLGRSHGPAQCAFWPKGKSIFGS